MNPFLSWAILLTVAGSLGYYYSNGQSNRGRTIVKPVAEKQDSAPTPKKNKRRTKKLETSQSRSRSPAPAKAQPVSVQNRSLGDGDDNKDANREFAKQFAKVRQGASLKPKSKETTRQPEHIPESHPSTRASSTTGAEADDDLSPATSPDVKAAHVSGDVSDMLESSGPGPSVLRLTGDFQEVKNKKKATLPSDASESKKHRQQRAKNEAKKAMVQQAEKERMALLEKQLHQSRDHERRETKKSAPTTNAWANGAPAAPQRSASVLLDTFEAAKPAEPTKSEHPSVAPQPGWTSNMPSEEEQMRLLDSINSENEWTTVSSRKKDNKKKTKADGSVSDTSSTDMTTPAVASADPPAAKPKSPVFPVKPVTHVEPATSNDPWAAGKHHPLDSDWIA